MNITRKALFTLLLCTVPACAAAPGDAGADDDTTTVEEALRAGITPGTFTMYGTPSHSPGLCDLYTTLDIKKTGNGSGATLENHVGGVCEIAAVPDLRSFRLKNASNGQSCGIQVYTGSKKTPAGRRSIRITDYRNATCALAVSAIVLEETLADGTTTTLYSAVEPTDPVDPNPVPAPTDPTPSACVRTGCSGQICADSQVITTCEFEPAYACYQSAICERGSDGTCGFRTTPALTACLATP